MLFLKQNSALIGLAATGVTTPANSPRLLKSSQPIVFHPIKSSTIFAVLFLEISVIRRALG
jgi:hypothetical protein